MFDEQHLIDLQGISKSFGDTEVLHNIDLYIRKREFVTLLGPSGCGKTTMLRIIGGFEMPTEGRVIFENQDITDLPPYRRRVNTVFQKYALFTHLNVFDNIAFGLKLRKLSKAEIARRVGKMLSLVKMEGYEKRSVESLSGGQQQRIAIARALVNEPEVLLLDEPLGALDLKLRKEMQLELKSMQQELGITFLYVTHDQEEALTISDTFVADFIGQSNLLSGIMLEDELVFMAGKEFPCVDEGFAQNEEVDVVVRPEDIMVVGPDVGMLVGVVESVLFKGVHYEMIVATEGGIRWKVHSTTMQPAGSTVGLSIVPFNIHIMRREGRIA